MLQGDRRGDLRGWLSDDRGIPPVEAGVAPERIRGSDSEDARSIRARIPGDPVARVRADGKHLCLHERPFRVRGVTYGSFRRRGDGEAFPQWQQVAADFAAMASMGLNTVRTYTPPPPDVLDLADEAGLRLIVGLHYEDWRYARVIGRRAHRRVLEAGRRAVDQAMTRCAGRAGVLGIAVGNEVPADLVRLHGISGVEEVLSALVEQVHGTDAGMLATYANYPTTEYLAVTGLDLACFNVFLEDPDRLRRYLRHLHIVSGDVPVVITELGLASEIHGTHSQASSLEWQLRLVDETACAGATVFSWTDDWAVADQPVEGWGFGITDATRRPKPAASVLRRWTSRSVRDLRDNWPRVSVVVCAYNERRSIGSCLESLRQLDYPGLEVIVCDDGSTDGTSEIARRFPFTVLELSHQGLSTARNAGIAASDADIIAFLDADAACHPEWLYHLVLSLEDKGVAATGGPNLPVTDAGLVERAVALSPGAPVHVLVTDDRAEHVPGCNMAFRRDALEAVGGFEPLFTTAGDDVDVCWKILDRGDEIAFAAGAQVHHHRRNSVRGYLRQQRGYGRAEGLLSRRHPHRFNRLGQARWHGFIYEGPTILPRLLRPVIYHGPMGLAPYQSVARRRSEPVAHRIATFVPLTVMLMPVSAMLALWSAWWLSVVALTLLLLCCYASLVVFAVRPERGEPRPVAVRLLAGALHVAQPITRSWARLKGGLGGHHDERGYAWAGDRASWLQAIELDLRARRCAVCVGGPDRAWDLRVWAGPLLCCQLTTAVVWNWLARSRAALRPRPSLIAATALGCLLLAVSVPLAAGWLSVLAAGACLELAVLLSRVRAVLTATTANAADREPNFRESTGADPS